MKRTIRIATAVAAMAVAAMAMAQDSMSCVKLSWTHKSDDYLSKGKLRLDVNPKDGGDRADGTGLLGTRKADHYFQFYNNCDWVVWVKWWTKPQFRENHIRICEMYDEDEGLKPWELSRVSFITVENGDTPDVLWCADALYPEHPDFDTCPISSC